MLLHLSELTRNEARAPEHQAVIDRICRRVNRGAPAPKLRPWTATHIVFSRRRFATLSRHRLWPITSRQNPSAVAQHDQPAWILGNAASIDRSGNGQVVVPIDDFLLAGALATLFEQLDGVFAFNFQPNTSY